MMIVVLELFHWIGYVSCSWIAIEKHTFWAVLVLYFRLLNFEVFHVLMHITLKKTLNMSGITLTNIQNTEKIWCSL